MRSRLAPRQGSEQRSDAFLTEQGPPWGPSRRLKLFVLAATSGVGCCPEAARCPRGGGVNLLAARGEEAAHILAGREFSRYMGLGTVEILQDLLVQGVNAIRQGIIRAREQAWWRRSLVSLLSQLPKASYPWSLNRRGHLPREGDSCH